MTFTRQQRAKARAKRAELARKPPYPDCGCPPETGNGIVNVVCTTADCEDFGTHRRALMYDRCVFCGGKYTRLATEQR